MRHRGKLRGDELTWRSRAAMLVHRKPFVYGTIVTSKRKCGNTNCKCKKERMEDMFRAIIGTSGEGQEDDFYSCQDAGEGAGMDEDA